MVVEPFSYVFMVIGNLHIVEDAELDYPHIRLGYCLGFSPSRCRNGCPEWLEK